jgi:hypothetical protein
MGHCDWRPRLQILNLRDPEAGEPGFMQRLLGGHGMEGSTYAEVASAFGRILTGCA